MKFIPLSYSSQLLFFQVLVVLVNWSTLPHQAASTTFDFKDFGNEVAAGDCAKGRRNMVCLQGDAALIPVDGHLHVDLTSNRLNKTVYFGSGRLVYSDPIPLWDNQTKTTNNFTSEFLFEIGIGTLGRKPHGDGIAFFLSPYPSIIPPNSTGGLFGLTSSNSSSSTDSSRFVAVELDSFRNVWDPTPFDHVGIDVNSVESKAYANLSEEGFHTGIGRARVTYNSLTRNLSVYVDFNENPFWLRTSILSYIIDLSEVLPEQIAVGFSAASSGSPAELHEILSWKFSTSLEDRRAEFRNKWQRRRIVVVTVLLLCLVLLVSACVFRKFCHASPKHKGSVRL